MSKFRVNMSMLARFAGRLDARVLAFHARYELQRRLHGSPLASRSRVLPSALYVETSSRCAGRCRGCYVPVDDRNRGVTLGPRELERIMAGARALQPDYVCIVGGEPLDESALETNLALVRGAPDMRFLLCTGAWGRCDGELMGQLARLPNLSVVFSIDGFETTHDRGRGKGNHARAIRALRDYAGSGHPLCGVSVTLRADSWAECSGEAFVRYLAGAGASWLVVDPCFTDGEEDALAPAQFAEAIRRLGASRAAADMVVFVNPFGLLFDSGFEPAWGMLPLAVDYLGHVYTSRRGRSLGNVRERDLVDILVSDQVQRACREQGPGGGAEDDPRRRLFEETATRLKAAGLVMR